MADWFVRVIANVILVLLVGYQQSKSWVYDDSGCRTPGDGVGNCVFLTECRAMNIYLKRLQKPVPEEILEQLDYFVCGAEDNQIKICCPSHVNDIQINVSMSRMSSRPIRTRHWVILDDEDNEDTCRTPDGGSGTCINIRQCKPILSFLQSVQRPIPDYVKRRLQAYTCSRDGKVCCPPRRITIDSPTIQNTPRPPPTTQNVVAPPDVSQHRNLNLLPTECGYIDIDNKIIFGEDAGLFEFPWMALLYYNTGRGPRPKCGGSVINERYILTAAHCLRGIRDPLGFVRVGEYDLSKDVDCTTNNNGVTKCADPVQDVRVEQIIPHPRFNTSDFDNDIGLIRVSKMNLTIKSARAVCLPTDESSRASDYNNSVVTGWGNINNLGTTAKILQKVELPIVPLQECQKIYGAQNIKINHLQVCAGARNGKDSCNGDSGGPLQVAAYINDDTRYVQQGIVSYGPRECGSTTVPAVYTRIPYFMDWILNNIKP